MTFLLTAMLMPAPPQKAPALTYLPSIQARWEISDLVCIGQASAPEPTGVIEVIDGARRDQLAAQVELEQCFKGEPPHASVIRVLGDSVVAMQDAEAAGGYGYAGPPTGFVSEGRNLLFLRRTAVPDDFLIAVPIYATAIPLGDDRPPYPPAGAADFVKAVVTRELENAIAEATDDADGSDQSRFLSDTEYADLLCDYLGKSAGVAELSRFSKNAPVTAQRDIAVLLFDLGQRAYEPAILSILLDPSIPAWKRGNAALGLGMYGSRAKELLPRREKVNRKRSCVMMRGTRSSPFASGFSGRKVRHSGKVYPAGDGKIRFGAIDTAC